MARLEFQFRQLERWPRSETPREKRKGSPFRTTLPVTLAKFAYELNRIGGINPVFITTSHSDRQVRIDGLPRADVTPPMGVTQFSMRVKRNASTVIWAPIDRGHRLKQKQRLGRKNPATPVASPSSPRRARELARRFGK